MWKCLRVDFGAGLPEGINQQKIEAFSPSVDMRRNVLNNENHRPCLITRSVIFNFTYNTIFL